MIKPIAIYGNPVLRKNSDSYLVGIELGEIITDLWETMYNANGAGLGAPQIAQSLRIFVIDLPDQEWKKVFINPVITEISGEYVVIEEGCLSIPDLSGPVVRKDEITVGYYDEKWKYHKEKYRGIRSRVIQHEYDHLDGILWVDKIEAKPNTETISVLQNCLTGNVQTSYPII